MDLIVHIKNESKCLYFLYNMISVKIYKTIYLRNQHIRYFLILADYPSIGHGIKRVREAQISSARRMHKPAKMLHLENLEKRVGVKHYRHVRSSVLVLKLN